MDGDGAVSYLAIAAGAVLGANARYLVAVWIAERCGTAFPYGTLVINVSGSFLLGLFLQLVTDRVIVQPHWRPFFAIGFLGGSTTFSAFSFESFALLLERSFVLAVANMDGSVLLGQVVVLMSVTLARLF